MKSSGTSGWNRSLIELTNTSRGVRHEYGIVRVSGCSVSAKPGPLVRGSPSVAVLGLAHGLQALGQRQRVAVVTTRGRAVTTRGRVPRRLGPLDARTVGHALLPGSTIHGPDRRNGVRQPYRCPPAPPSRAPRCSAVDRGLVSLRSAPRPRQFRWLPGIRRGLGFLLGRLGGLRRFRRRGRRGVGGRRCR